MRWRVKFGFVGRVRCWICLSSRKIYFCLKIVVNCIRSKFCEVVNKFCNWLYKYIGFVSGHDIYCCVSTKMVGDFFFRTDSTRGHEEPGNSISERFPTVTVISHRAARSFRSFRRETKSSEINTSPEDIPLEISPRRSYFLRKETIC